MRNKATLFISLLVVLALVLAACGGDSTDTTVGDTGDSGDSGDTVEDVNLTVLVHANPPMTAFLETFNAEFEAANPGVTVDMSVVAPGDLATVTQTRLTANDVMLSTSSASRMRPSRTCPT